MPHFQIFSPQQIESLRHGGGILRACLDYCASIVKEGITTEELDIKAEEFIRSHEGAEPAFKGYRNFPATLCTSVNEVCVHGLPGNQTLQNGDIISIDCGVLYNALYTDACLTVAIGEIDSGKSKLLNVTRQALYDGLSVIKDGTRTGDISAAVQKTVENNGFNVVKALTGHGLGDNLHQFPDIPNFGKPDSGYYLPANTIIAIEPIVTAGRDGIKEAPDKWSVIMKDGAPTAHFEHTVLVTQGGYEIIA